MDMEQLQIIIRMLEKAGAGVQTMFIVYVVYLAFVKMVGVSIAGVVCFSIYKVVRYIADKVTVCSLEDSERRKEFICSIIKGKGQWNDKYYKTWANIEKTLERVIPENQLQKRSDR